MELIYKKDRKTRYAKMILFKYIRYVFTKEVEKAIENVLRNTFMSNTGTKRLRTTENIPCESLTTVHMCSKRKMQLFFFFFKPNHINPDVPQLCLCATRPRRPAGYHNYIKMLHMKRS